MLFSASLLLEDVVDGRSKEQIFWEERIVLVEADSSDEAIQKAEEIGAEAQHSYVAANGDTVTVTFRQIERIYELQPNQIKHGSELFSRILRTHEVESLLTPFE